MDRTRALSSRRATCARELTTALGRLRRFEVWGRTFVLNVATGQTYRIGPGEGARLLDAVAPVDAEVSPGLEETARVLPETARRALHQMGHEGVAPYLRAVRSAQRRKVALTPTAFTVNLTHACNLACRYCYAERLYLVRNGPRAPVHPPSSGPRPCRTTPAHMTRATAERCMEFMLQQGVRAGTGQLRVCFFGGEPMLRFDLLRHMVLELTKRAASNGLSILFELSTNGTILSEEQLAFLEKHEIIVQISFDGCARLQNGNRPFAAGRKRSFATVVANLKKALQRLPHVEVRSTLPAEECDFAAVGQALVDIGVTTFNMDVASAHELPWDGPLGERLCRSLGAWCRRYYDMLRGRGIIDQTFASLARMLCTGGVRIRACGAALERAAIGCDGTLWPCHTWCGTPFAAWVLGDVGSGLCRRETIRLIRSWDFQTRPVCRTCWARTFCAGGCFLTREPPAAVRGGKAPVGSNGEMACALLKERVKLTAWLIGELRQKDPAALQVLLDVPTRTRQESKTKWLNRTGKVTT